MQVVACELCGSRGAHEFFRQRDLTHRISDEEFIVVRCDGCGLLYLNPRPNPDEIGRYYPPQYFSDLAPRPRAALEQSLKRWSRWIKRWVMEEYYGYPSSEPGHGPRILRKLVAWPDMLWRRIRGREILPWTGRGRLLDVGCGPGANLATFEEQGWEVHGVDNSEVAVQRARSRFGDRVRSGDLLSVRYEDRSFDVVLFSHALEHMYDPVAVLQEARRILDDAGRVVITLPNAGSLEAKLFGRWWFPWELPRHLHHFEKPTLKKMLAKAGLRPVRVRTGVGSLFFMASLERVWEHKLGRKLPARWLWERLIARPLCLIAGHLGYGTEMTVHAVKA
jgi:SAM-dependent methyltransferase